MNYHNFHLYSLVTILIVSVVAADDRNHKKRQIYREEVLPHAGGKIPDTAFQSDRLFLNRLQKEGIAVPDGIVPEQRNPQVYPLYNKQARTVYRIALSSDARYIPNEGRYHFQEIPSIETTYLYPQIHGQQMILTPSAPAYPVYRQLQIHNPHLNQLKFQPKKKEQLLNGAVSNGKGRVKTFKSESYQNFNLLNTPISQLMTPPSPSSLGKSSTKSLSLTSPLGDQETKHYFSNYGNTHLFNDFDDLFNNFNLHETESSVYDKSKAFQPSRPIVY